MRKSRFTEEQIIEMLGEREAGVPAPDVCRKHGLSAATFQYPKCERGEEPLRKRLRELAGER